MGEINIPSDERDALKAIDNNVLNKLIEQCLHEERPTALRILRLESCGPYAAAQLRIYEKALAEHRKAKLAKKRAETEYRARCAGSNLAHAIQQMKHRVETEAKEGLLFYVDDQILPPYRFSEHVTVRVSYRWRRAIEDEWTYGSVTFSHEVDLRPDYTMPLPRRKLSAAKQEQERQDKLYREWEHLMKLGLYSLRDYFKGGGDGSKIPKSFQAKTDSYSRGLNNFSAKFWL
ncbi:hypothetical protein [Xanthomonas hortorum]|uniref:hypothetical protein n=1 Tax=Xanthomonas hortorum TaxID=56454 RepID=UPI00159381A5|nr:hypothetical protein [Xanthomonas hortorum]NHF68002.1 hypothetical protein [Xanthomonas hortorum]